MKHVFLTPAECYASAKGTSRMYLHDRGACPVCDGGLAICQVCNGAEGGLATDCPGVTLTEMQERDICRLVLDFIDGKWVVGELEVAAAQSISRAKAIRENAT